MSRISVVKYVSVWLLWSVARVLVVLGSAPWTEIAPRFINKTKVFSQKQNSYKPPLRLILNMPVFDVKFSFLWQQHLSESSPLDALPSLSIVYSSARQSSTHYWCFDTAGEGTFITVCLIKSNPSPNLHLNMLPDEWWSLKSSDGVCLLGPAIVDFYKLLLLAIELFKVQSSLLLLPRMRV